jgi:hypothetical protein
LGIGYGLKDLKEACGSFDADAVEVDAPIPASGSGSTQQTELVIAPQQEKVVLALTTAVRQALEATQPAPVRDPLRSYRLPAGGIGPEVSTHLPVVEGDPGGGQSTINSWSAEVSRNGFLLKRVGPGKWRVYREEEQDA